MKSPVFTIIVLTYNEGKYIGELLSALATYSNEDIFELIIVDSGSKDQTVDVILSYQTKFSLFNFIQIPTEKFHYSETRNFAVSQARGKYVGFFCAKAVPLTEDLFAYIRDDFKLDNNIVSVYGKQIPRASSSVNERAEISCIFHTLDKYRDKNGLLIQDIANPFIPFSQQNQLVWYGLFNSFVFYRRDFLDNYKFQGTSGEDTLMGKTIVELGFIKVYDSRCVVTHSHDLNLLSYISRYKITLNSWYDGVKVSKQSNYLCKLKYVFQLKAPLIKMIYYINIVNFYYLIKVMLFLYYKLWIRNVSKK